MTENLTDKLQQEIEKEIVRVRKTYSPELELKIIAYGVVVKQGGIESGEGYLKASSPDVRKAVNKEGDIAVRCWVNMLWQASEAYLKNICPDFDERLMKVLDEKYPRSKRK